LKIAQVGGMFALKPIQISIKTSKYARGPNEEKKYTKKVLQPASQKLLPDDTSSLLYLVDSNLIESYRVLDSLFQKAISTNNVEVIQFLRSNLKREQISQLSEVSNDVKLG
jgi:hypothetical protein